MIRPRRWSSFGISWLIEKMPKILWWDTEENLLEMEEDDIEKGAFKLNDLMTNCDYLAG